MGYKGDLQWAKSLHSRPLTLCSACSHDYLCISLFMFQFFVQALPDLMLGRGQGLQGHTCLHLPSLGQTTLLA